MTSSAVDCPGLTRFAFGIAAIPSIKSASELRGGIPARQEQFIRGCAARGDSWQSADGLVLSAPRMCASRFPATRAFCRIECQHFPKCTARFVVRVSGDHCLLVRRSATCLRPSRTYLPQCDARLTAKVALRQRRDSTGSVFRLTHRFGLSLISSDFTRPPAALICIKPGCRWCDLYFARGGCDAHRVKESRSGGNPGEKQVRAVACDRGIHCTNSSAALGGLGRQGQGVGLTAVHDIGSGNAGMTRDSEDRLSPAGTHRQRPAPYASKRDSLICDRHRVEAGGTPCRYCGGQMYCTCGRFRDVGGAA